MPRLRPAERALTLLTTSTGPRTPHQHICLSCRRRTLHTTPILPAELSFLKRIQQSVFGSTESKEAERKREAARQVRVEELAQQPAEERATGGTVVDVAGREYEVAALVDESLDKTYKPAKDWKGLRRVGSEEWVQERADGGEVYVGFVQPKKVDLSDEQWKRLLHHVAVEALVLRQAGRDLAQMCLPRRKTTTWKYTSGISIKVEGDGVTLTSNGASVERLLQRIPEKANPANPNAAASMLEEVKGATAMKSMDSVRLAQEDDAWMQIPLADPAIKLAILKRLTQLSGTRPRDALVSPAATLADLHTVLKAKEPPKKLARTPQLQALRADNPNVTVRNRRVTPIDKHAEVGRWKVITEELEARGLPVTGTRWKEARTRMALELDGKKETKGKKGRRESVA